MTERRSKPSKTEAPEHLTVREADVRYPDQWVLMKVTALDDLRTPLEGEIVVHGTRRQVHKAMMVMTVGGKRPESLLYVFCAGTHERSLDDIPDDIEPILPWGGTRARRGR